MMELAEPIPTVNAFKVFDCFFCFSSAELLYWLIFIFSYSSSPWDLTVSIPLNESCILPAYSALLSRDSFICFAIFLAAETDISIRAGIGMHKTRSTFQLIEKRIIDAKTNSKTADNTDSEVDENSVSMESISSTLAFMYPISFSE